MAYDFKLTDEEGDELLRIARATLCEFTRTGKVPPGKPHRESLLAQASVFVTLRRGGILRGCIGSPGHEMPLYQSVQEMAVAAASRDPRFKPVTPGEVDDLSIEVSVLGENQQVKGPSDIEVGTHGLRVACQGRSGLLLPQVATEKGWDAKTFFEEVCVKAGLPSDCWKEEARIERFTAQIFSEDAP